MEYKSEPGDHIKWFAETRGWSISSRNILVEGESDKEYFQLASNLHFQKYSKTLICHEELSIIPVGKADDGGVYGILNYFPAFRLLIDSDISPLGERLFYAVALLDNDPKGKQAFRALTGRHAFFRENRDIFLLHRKFPRNTIDPTHLENCIRKENEPWKDLDCVIEDLLSIEIIQGFLDESDCNPIGKLISKSGGYHLQLPSYMKPSLLRYAKKNAIYSDMVLYIEVLKSFRYYLGLDPNGDSQGRSKDKK